MRRVWRMCWRGREVEACPEEKKKLLFTHNYVRQGFYSPVAIRKLAVTKFYPVLMKLRKKSQIKLLTASNAQAKVL